MLKNRGHQVARSPSRQLKLKRITFILGLWLLLFNLYPCYAAEEDFVYDPEGKRNPFIPLVTRDGKLLKLDSDKGEGGMSLEGIIYDEQGISYAIINNEVVKIGDNINGYDILRIEENKVIFIKEGEPLELELKKEE